MVKLVVEEVGKRRTFRMGPGVLTVGSGAEARLKLASTEVAEIHLELELGTEGVKLRPRPGVVPPKVAGQPVSAERVLAPGHKVEIGGARLWIEAEAGEAAAAAPSAAAPAGAPPAPSGTGPAPVVTRRSGARDEGRSSRRARRERSDEDDERPRGMPIWVVPVVILAITAILFLAWQRLLQKGAGSEGMAVNKLRAAQQAAAIGHFEEARAELAGIPDSALTPELSQRKAQVEEAIRAGDEASASFTANESGTRYLDTLLKKYEGNHLQGKPDPAKVRLFLKRCRTFRERWPQHPEMDWVARQEARFAGYVDMNAPATWADVSWEVKSLTEGAPRNYVAAFALLDELDTRISGEEATKAKNLRGELVKQRVEYANDRLYQAKYEFEKKDDPVKAVWWLVHSIAWLGDEALANESARVFVKMPDLAGHLRGYKKNYPDRYEALMKNAIVASWVQENDFKP